MADEVLNLRDNISPGLKKIADQAQRMAREFGNLTKATKLLDEVQGPLKLENSLRQIGIKAMEAKRRVKELQQVIKEGAVLPGSSFNLPRGANGKFQRTGGVMTGGSGLVYPAEIEAAKWRKANPWINSTQPKEGLGYYSEKENFARRQAMIRADKWAQYHSRQAQAQERVSRGAMQNGNALDHLARKLITLYVIFTTLQQVVSAFASVVKTYDEMISIKTRMSMINGTNQNTQQFMGGVYGMANRTRGNIQDTANLYTRIGTSGVRASNKEIASFVERFNKSMVISGTGAQENRAVMLQIAQAMGSNRLGGDEYRSIAEQAPIFKYMLAKGLGVNPGQLKKMGAEGKLTARVIMEAFKKSGAEIDKIFEKMPWTVEQLGRVIQNKWTQKVSENLSSWKTLQSAMSHFIQWLDSKEGDQFLNDLLTSINKIIDGTVQFFQFISPVIRFVVKHLSEILSALNIVLAIILAIKAVNFAGVLLGIEGAVISLTAATLGWVAALTAGLGLLLYIMQQKNLVFDANTESDIHEQYKEKEYQKIYWQERRKAGTIVTVGEDRAAMDRAHKRWDPIAKKFDEDWNKHSMKLSNQKQADPFADLKGMLDPNKNKDINRVGEVGKINSDITISEESLKYMRALAEREWILQNETYIPQVTMNNTIHKTADVDEALGKFADATETFKGSRVCTNRGGASGR